MRPWVINPRSEISLSMSRPASIRYGPTLALSSAEGRSSLPRESICKGDFFFLRGENERGHRLTFITV